MALGLSFLGIFTRFTDIEGIKTRIAVIASPYLLSSPAISPAPIHLQSSEPHAQIVQETGFTSSLRPSYSPGPCPPHSANRERTCNISSEALLSAVCLLLLSSRPELSQHFLIRFKPWTPPPSLFPYRVALPSHRSRLETGWTLRASELAAHPPRVFWVTGSVHVHFRCIVFFLTGTPSFPDYPLLNRW